MRAGPSPRPGDDVARPEGAGGAPVGRSARAGAGSVGALVLGRLRCGSARSARRSGYRRAPRTAMLAASLAWASRAVGPRGTPPRLLANVRRGAEPAARPSMRTSYAVTLPEAPAAPASRPRQGCGRAPRSPLPCCSPPSWGSCSTKPRYAGPFSGTLPPRLGFCLLTGVLPSRPLPPRARRAGHRFFPAPPSFPRVSRQGMPPSPGDLRITRGRIPLAEVPAPHPKSPWPLPLLDPSTRWLLGSKFLAPIPTGAEKRNLD